MSTYPVGGPVRATEDPGRTLGIVGLVLAFITSLPGLIVSIIAFRKSKKAGFSNTIAKVGIIIGSIFTALALVITAVSIVGVIALAKKCADLGPGVHQSGTTTVTCG